MSAARGTNDEPRAWFDLSRRDIRDALTVLGLAGTVLIATTVFSVAKFVLGHGGDDRFQILSMTLALMACAILAVAFGLRRLQDLRREILARLAAEQNRLAVLMLEEAKQLACLKANGCVEGQGYLFGSAVPAAEVHNLLSPKSKPAVA